MKIQKKYSIFMLICFSSLALSACGIKPNNLESPTGNENTQFPSTYPQITQKP